VVWRVKEAPYAKDGAEAFVVFLHGAQLVLRSSVLTVATELDEVNVTLRSIFVILRSLMGRCYLEKVDLLVAGGAAEVLPFPLNYPLPLLRTHPPSLLVCCFCFLVFAEMGATSTASKWLEINLFLSEKRGG